MRSTKPMSRGSLSILLATVFVAIFAIVGTGSAFAACSEPFNCFAGDDGDQASGPNGLTDWQDIAASVTPIDDPAKGADTKFSGGDKETEPGSWDFITGNNTPKTDILEGWSSFDGRYLEVAFSRVKQNGDTFLAFEMNQDPAGPRMSGGIAVPHRSPGDLLFTYDISTTNKLSFGMCYWDGDSNTGDWRMLDGTPLGGSVKECTTLNKSTSPAAEGNVNWSSPIDPNYLTDFKPIGTGQFGEAVVDLGALGTKFVTNPCSPNGWIWMHSRAARPVLSQPKDILAGTPISDPSCSYTIDKKVSATGQPGTFVDADQQHPFATEVGQTVTYAVTVSNTGDSPLTMTTSDDFCTQSGSGLSDGSGHSGSGDVLGVGSSITYTCTHVVDGNENGNPFQNLACASAAEMPAGNSKCDDAWVESFQPGQLASGTGSKFLDANANGVHDGDEGGIAGFVFYVDYNDNGALDAGEPAAASAADGTWTISGIKPGTYNVREANDPNYTCTVPAGSCSYNVTFAGGQTTAIGEFGNAPVPQQQEAPTQQSGGSNPPDKQVVLGERITPGRARLLGPTGCAASAFHARIRGVKVATVVFFLDGHRIKTLSRKNYRGTFAVRIDPSRLRVGVHRLVVKVTFQRGSATKAKTFRLAFQRCPRALRAPRFTG